MAVKKHKCKQCKEYRENTIKTLAGRFCNVGCLLLFSNQKKAKNKDREFRERRKRLNDNDRSLRTKCAQRAFNAYIRERDKDKGCISCGTTTAGQYHAGHYRSVGAHPELRFNEQNCHLQCAQCNNFQSGRIIDYRIELISRVGLDRVQWLEGKHEPKKYTCEELRAIELTYKKKLKELKIN